jgi:hypothetical protein
MGNIDHVPIGVSGCGCGYILPIPAYPWVK